MFVWNQNKSGCVNFEKVRNLTMVPTSSGIDVIAWFSDSQTVLMGSFRAAGDAERFLEDLLININTQVIPGTLLTVEKKGKEKR